jgi:NAD(P)-dependent dehydrogenase (short-subunit alcohol dehydrogenase family)
VTNERAARSRVASRSMTGAGQGIGRAIALAYAREGADVAVGELDPVKAKSTAEAVRALGRQSAAIVGDVGVREDCERMVAETVRELGGLDVLVNGAAWAQPNTPIHETSDELYQRTFDVCMTSVFWTSRAAYPHLKKSGRGCVINFASNAGTEGMAGNAVYAATKEAIRGFSRSLAREWGRDGNPRQHDPADRRVAEPRGLDRAEPEARRDAGARDPARSLRRLRRRHRAGRGVPRERREPLSHRRDAPRGRRRRAGALTARYVNISGV